MSNNFIFSKDGTIKYLGIIIGSWEKRDIWQESHAPKGYDFSGNKLAHYVWKVELINGWKDEWCYTKREAYESVAFQYRQDYQNILQIANNTAEQ